MEQQEAIRVSVIIPCRNEVGHIRACLDSIFGQERNGISMEVLVADGMSDDGTRQILGEFEQRFENLRVLDNPGKIASTGLNRAVRESTGEIIVRMDAHSLCSPDYVRSSVDVLQETNADNVGGPALTRAEGYLAQAIAHAFHTRFASGGAKFHNPQYEGPVDTVTYGCWRKPTLERLGLFDEKLVRGQDDELNLRLVASGGRVWQSPRIISWYSPRAGLARLFRQYLQYGFWKVAVIRKHRKLPSWRNIVPSVSALVGIALLLGWAGAGVCGAVLWEHAFIGVWLALVAFYLLASVGTAFLVARREGWIFFPALPLVFATYHFSYALGFLLAVLYHPLIWEPPSPIPRVFTAITR
jgi:succinoglycan biosynthesis protein ExoA